MLHTLSSADERKTIRHEIEVLLEQETIASTAKLGILRDNAKRFYRC